MVELKRTCNIHRSHGDSSKIKEKTKKYINIFYLISFHFHHFRVHYHNCKFYDMRVEIQLFDVSVIIKRQFMEVL